MKIECFRKKMSAEHDIYKIIMDRDKEFFPLPFFGHYVLVDVGVCVGKWHWKFDGNDLPMAFGVG